MHKLIEYVCEELKDLEKKADKSGGLTSSEIEYADKLAHLKKNLLKGEELYDEMVDYSGNTRDDTAMSHRRDGGHRDGSYARGRGSRANRDTMGRYSSEYGYSRDAAEMASKLRDLMHDAPDESTRREIERLVEKVEQM